jgi:molybdate transport system ATP-binding protein
MIRLEHKVMKDDFELDVDVEIPDSGITGVFGASGSGKTTLLRCIAGLEGEGGLPVHARNVGYVFQQPTLFPHLSVRGNIEYGARRAKTQRIDNGQVVDMLDLGGFLERRADTLSGGEAQRVAIAAALMRSPDLVLMDEPLASLDRARKDELLPYFDRLHDELSVPVVYVSHDIEEVSRLCDHLVLLEEGRVTMSGDRATPVEHEYGLTRFDFGDGDIWVPGEIEAGPNPLRLRIAASDVSLCRVRPEETTILNILRATIEEIRDVSEAAAIVRLGVGNQALLAQVTRRSVSRLALREGDQVFAQIKSVTVRR